MSISRIRRRARRDDRGAIFLEFILALPFLLIVAFGLVEMGMAWTQVTRVSQVTSSSARVLASSGSNAAADKNALLSLQASLDSESKAQLVRVIIYKPNVDESMPCATNITSNTSSCNVYTGSFVRSMTSATTISSYGWNPTTRQASLGSLPNGPDRIGLYVETRHLNQTHTFFGDFTISKKAVYQIEPGPNG